MKFFVPNAAKADYASTYDAIIDSVKEQMRIPITARKIFSLSYVHDKKRFTAQVGQPDPQEGRYEVLAILEAKPYVVFARGKDAARAGLTMLVNDGEVSEVIDFE